MTRHQCVQTVFALLFFPFSAGAWAAAEGIVPRPEHPRPEAVRGHWAVLNGTWDFQFDPTDKGVTEKWSELSAPAFEKKIVVPFGWESELSGIHETKYRGVAWYRRTFEVPKTFPADDRVWLRFEAVDYRADVWVNGKPVVQHEGGYSPFAADITEALAKDGHNILVVRAFDPTDPSLPTGKQVGWYTPTSGIWQTVWLEARPTAHIDSFTIQTQIDPAVATIELALAGAVGGKAKATVESTDKSFEPVSIEVVDPTHVKLAIKFANPKLWSPESPHLYPIRLALESADGKVDSVETYFGLRTIARGRWGEALFERILLNGKPIFLRGALDQSFNPKGIYTAPDDAFLKHDIQLAKDLGLNMLRIHIKPDEPRRLYWADKLGVLILEDMPNTWRQNEKARAAWEKTMREVVARDLNHPAIIAWIDFNETWGLGSPGDYKASADTQKWVKSMVALNHQLDPTRLVEDNSPCNNDHVEGTDLNSWHFYIDEHTAAQRHVAEVVAQSKPGSSFNYCPGQKMNSAPLINSEYGGVSAGSGDRDISWSFRDLTTLLRKQPSIQGYVYTELDDIEWEHNGFVNYDRTPKLFGYDAFVPNMTPADLQGADFIGYDAPPVVVVKPDEPIRIPLFVSHYSDRKNPPTLRWWVVGHNHLGQKVELEPKTRPVEWTPFGVTALKHIGVKIDTPFVGAFALELVDESGKRIAANFVNIVVRDSKPAPRVERIDDREVAVRFEPGAYAKSHWSGVAPIVDGKAQGRGKGSFVYKLKLPASVVKAGPAAIELMIEASARAGRERVDWPDRVNRQDNPQTDTRKWPSTLVVTLNGQKFDSVELADDPADARGVLSHLDRIDHGSYGQIVHLRAPLNESVKAALAKGQPLELKLSVPDDATHAGGLAIFGENTGAYPFDPSLMITTSSDLPDNMGVKPDASITVDTPLNRQIVVLATGESRRPEPALWSFTTSDPGEAWFKPKFDTKAWNSGRAGFGSNGTPGLHATTKWRTNDIWLRTTVDLPVVAPDDQLILRVYHDENAEIWVNGEPIFSAQGYTATYEDTPLGPKERNLFHAGANSIAVHCHQTSGGQGIDVGLKVLRDQ